MNRWLPIAVAALLALGAGVLLYVRANPAPARAARQARDASRTERYQDAQALFATFSVRPLAELASAEEVAAVLAHATQQTPLPEGAGSRDDLLAHVAAFLYQRFINDDPAAYRAWREASGYGMVPWDEMVEFWGVDADYARHFGEPPAGIAAAEAFDRMWSADAEAGARNVGRPIAIVDDPRAIVVRGGRFSRLEPGKAFIDTGSLERGIPAALWQGAGVIGFSRWYGSRERDGTLNQVALMRTTGPIAYGDVAMVLEFPDGTRVPVLVGCCWDPEHALWSIETLGVMNLAGERTGPKVF
ncbi:MAG: hypothetical protein KDA05_10660 [Phycisphaerales bacterium]|nr:hypothetical protein [Phycisphaerales bacterium]